MKIIKVDEIIEHSYKSEEAYKALRANIEFCGKEIKTIAVTSCIPDEGKSMISLNLAVAMAEAGRKVLYIDSDMRRSSLNGKVYVENNELGFSNLLASQCSDSDVLHSTSIENLFMVLAGGFPPNPSELLSRPVFADWIHKFRAQFDYVIIDTPPLGSVIDSAIIGKECDGIALVIADNTVSRTILKEVIAQLEKAECKVLGAVLNKVDMSENSRYGKYYKKYYGKYYGKRYGKHLGKKIH